MKNSPMISKRSGHPRPFMVVLALGLLLMLLLTLLANGVFPPTYAAASLPSLPLISLNAPAYTNDTCSGSFPASRADDNNYGTQWEGCTKPSATRPTWLAYDLSHALHG